MLVFLCRLCIHRYISLSQPLNVRLSDYRTIVVSVKSNVAKTEALVMQIEGAILSALKNQGKFSSNSLVPILAAGFRHVNLNCYTGPLGPLPYLQ
jgi:hypothetical protein